MESISGNWDGNQKFQVTLLRKEKGYGCIKVIAQRYHTPKASIFTVSSALTAVFVLPNFPARQTPIHPSRPYLNMFFSGKPSLIQSQLSVPSSVLLYGHIYYAVTTLTGNFVSVSPTTSLRTRINYLIHLCIPKTQQSAWQTARVCCVIKDIKSNMKVKFALHLQKSNWFLVLFMCNCTFP